MIKRRAREPESISVFFYDTGDESHDHRATLYYRDVEVCALPVGMLPERDIIEYECFRCRIRATHPWVCNVGQPPPGIERRGLEFLREPTGQGHEIIKRLRRRGWRSILRMCEEWRHPDTGVRLFRE